MTKALNEKVEKDPHFWKPVTPCEIDHRDHDRLGAMRIGQQRYKQSSSYRLADHDITQSHNSCPVEREPQDGIAAVGRDGRSYLSMNNAVARFEWPPPCSRYGKGNAAVIC